MGLFRFGGADTLGQLHIIASGKGGTGKTSLCAALGASLAREGASVLLIDADVGLRNLDIPLGLSNEATIPFTRIISGDYPLSSAAQHPALPGLHLLTAPQSIADVRPEPLRDFCAQVRDTFEFCLIDAPAGLGAGFQLAAQMADTAIVVVGGDPASLRDGAAASAALQRCGVRSGHVIANRVRPKLYEKMHVTIDDVMDGVGLPLLGVVPEDENVTLAAVCGKPLALYTGKGAQRACTRIARRLLGRRVPLPKRL